MNRDRELHNLFKKPNVFEYLIFDLNNYSGMSHKEKLVAIYHFSHKFEPGLLYDSSRKLFELEEDFERFLQLCNKVTPIK